MPYSTAEIRKFLGLFDQANSFSLPDGAMEKALNIVINDDDVISKTRGFYQYFAPVTGTLNQIFKFSSRLFAVYANKISYLSNTGTAPNETGTETVLSGQSFTVSGGRISRGVEEGGNLYFTTDDGTLKIDAYNGTIIKAGAPSALDVRGNFLSQNGPISGQCQLGVRVVFGRKDANQNTVLGAPSDMVVLTNQKVLTVAWTRTANVVTVASTGHNLTSGMSIVISGSAGGVPEVTAGTSVVTVTSANAFTIVSTGADDLSGNTLDYTATRAGLYEFSVPTDITATSQNWFYQVYRTTQSSGSTVSPDADFRLIDEVKLSSSEIADGFVSYVDTVDDVLVEFAPELYTNPNSREGESQANARPPLAEDICLFNNMVLYAKCQSRHYVDLDVADVDAMATGDFIEVKVLSADGLSSTTRRYVARTGIGNRTAKSDSVTNDAGDLRIDYVGHGLLNGDSIYVSTVSGGSLAAGAYFVVSKTTDTFEISLTSGGASIAHSAVSYLYFQGDSNGTYSIFHLDQSGTTAVELRNTAQGIVKAINRDASAIAFGNYVSGITDTPGQTRISAKGFTGTISLRASTSGAGGAFFPVLPASFSTGEQVSSTNDSEQSAVYISKIGQGEAVPLLNKIFVGSKNQPIKRILPLRNSVIVLKVDGVFKITGNRPDNMEATSLDATVSTEAANSAAVLNNRVHFQAVEGVCSATDTGVDIISRRIENRFEPIAGVVGLDTATAAVGYETDRTYRLSTVLPNETTKTGSYFYNVINDTWTESDMLFSGGAVGPENVLFLISTDNRIMKERKKNTKIDYSNQNYAVSMVSVVANQLSGVLNSPDRTPLAGDFIVFEDVITRLKSVDQVSAGNFTVTFHRVTNMVALSAGILYERHVSEIKMAPFHAGLVGRGKQFSEIQIYTRTPNINRLFLTFLGQFVGGSEETDWLYSAVRGAEGWGYLPWGFFPWGLSETILSVYSTEPSPPIRLYIPHVQQRNTFIQAYLAHREGGEPMDIQALSYTVRAYRERVSK